MGLPEDFAPVNNIGPIGQYPKRLARKPGANSQVAKNARSKRALFVIPDIAAPRGAQTRQILGYQYVLGFFPLTRVYLQRGVESLIEETALEVLQSQGFLTSVCRQADSQAAAELLEPELILKIRPSEVTVNAYDAFFFRILSVTGAVDVEFLAWNADSLMVVKKARETFSERRNKRFGYAPLLASLLKDSVSRSISKLLVHAPGRRVLGEPAKMVKVLDAGDILVFVSAPYYAEPPAVKLGEFFASSYGFESLAPFNGAQILRLVQLGVQSGIEELRPHVVVLDEVGPDADVLGLRAGSIVWELRTQVERLLPMPPARGPDADALEVVLGFSLLERSRQGEALLAQLRCRAVENRVQGVDGHWTFTLEQASGRLAKAFFSGQKSDKGERFCGALKQGLP